MDHVRPFASRERRRRSPKSRRGSDSASLSFKDSSTDPSHQNRHPHARKKNPCLTNSNAGMATHRWPRRFHPKLQRRAAISGEWNFQPCSALLPNLPNLNSAAHSLGTRILHSLTWHRHRVDYLKAVSRRRRSSPPVGVAERQIGW